MRKLLAVTSAVLVVPLSIMAQQVKISVAPNATYLRTAPDDLSSTVPINLADIGVSPGDFVRFSRTGEINDHMPDWPLSVRYGIVGVFSTSNELLPPSELRRVVGAVSCEGGCVTLPSARNGAPTDIPEDFTIDDTVVQVPAGATYLFLSPNDNSWSDNQDLDNDFGVVVSPVDPPQTPGLEIHALPSLLIEGTVGAAYRIEYTEAVQSGSWITLTELILTNSPQIYTDASVMTNATKRFYRVVAK